MLRTCSLSRRGVTLSYSHGSLHHETHRNVAERGVQVCEGEKASYFTKPQLHGASSQVREEQEEWPNLNRLLNRMYQDSSDVTTGCTNTKDFKVLLELHLQIIDDIRFCGLARIG